MREINAQGLDRVQSPQRCISQLEEGVNDTKAWAESIGRHRAKGTLLWGWREEKKREAVSLSPSVSEMSYCQKELHPCGWTPCSWIDADLLWQRSQLQAKLFPWAFQAAEP